MSAELVPSDVSVIVPLGGAAPAWERCAASLARLDPPPGELIVVLDGPNPRLEAVVAQLDARVVELPARSGPARARNAGAEVAQGELFFFTDSDVELPVKFLDQLTAEANERVGAAALIGSYDDQPGHPGFCSQYRNLLHHFVHQQGREQASTFWSGCGAIRRAAFEEVGGFDESYPVPSIEDIELGARLLRAGHEIDLVKNLQVCHLKEWTAGNMLSTDLWRRAVPWTRLMLREGKLVNDLNVKVKDRLSVALAPLLVFSLLQGLLFRPALWVAGAVFGLLLLLNLGFFAFLWRKRGLLFAARAVPFYLLYLLICGAGFALGWVRHFQSRSSD